MKTLIFSILAIGIIILILGLGFNVQPFSDWTDGIAAALNISGGNIASAEYYAFRPANGGLVVHLLPKNAEVGKAYIAELYQRGKLRDSKLVRFTKPEIEYGQVKEVVFILSDADWAGVTGSLSEIFNVKVRPSN